jgi:hypothetical protein
MGHYYHTQLKEIIMNFRLHSDFQKDSAMDEVLCPKHLAAMLKSRSVGYNEFFKAHYTVTEVNHPCEDCSQVSYESRMSEG